MPRPPNATSTRTRTSTLVEAVRRRADEARAVGIDSAGQADHRRSHRRRVDPVPRDVDARELGGYLVVAEGAERPPDVRELEHAEDDQEADEHAGEEVVGADAIVGEVGGSPRHDETRLASRQVAPAEEQVGEREREHQRDDPGEDDAERAPHRDPAQRPRRRSPRSPSPPRCRPRSAARSCPRGWPRRSRRRRRERRRTGRAGSCTRRSG